MARRHHNLIHAPLRHLMLGLMVSLMLGGAALTAKATRRVPTGSQPSASAAVGQLKPGPWGDLSYRRIVIAPPLNAVPSPQGAGETSATVWAFPQTTRLELAELLADLDLAESSFAALLDATFADAASNGFVTTPPADLVRRLDPQARARLYRRLGQTPANRAHINAFRFWGESVGDWLEGAALSPQTIAAVEPLVYRNDEMLFFADLPLVESGVADAGERQRLVQALARESTLMLTLHVSEGQDIEPLVRYWGRGGRGKDVRLLLASLARTPGGGSIDVVHLLPSFARARLYTYPTDEVALPTGDSRDCHWTAMNFFHSSPDDRYANAEVVAAAMQRDYEPVREPRLGDLVVFACGGEVFHTAVYIADDVLFTKNGPRFSRPWMLMPLSAMEDFYPRTAPVTVRYLRQRSMSGSAMGDEAS